MSRGKHSAVHFNRVGLVLAQKSTKLSGLIGLALGFECVVPRLKNELSSDRCGRINGQPTSAADRINALSTCF